MAVDANHLASVDLLVEPVDADPKRHEPCDIRDLRPDVVELEHHGISLAAVTTGMVIEVGENVSLSPQLAPSLRGL